MRNRHTTTEQTHAEPQARPGGCSSCPNLIHWQRHEKEPNRPQPDTVTGTISRWHTDLPQNRCHCLVQRRTIRRQQIGYVDVERPAGSRRDQPPRFAHQQHAGRHVPRQQAR